MLMFFNIFFFNYPATTEIYTLSLHDALPISKSSGAVMIRYKEYWGNEPGQNDELLINGLNICAPALCPWEKERSEEHTSELQSHSDLVCRLLLEKKKKHQDNGNRHHDNRLHT